MAKPAAKRPNVDSGRSDSFLRMLALEKQYRMQRIHTQVAAASTNSNSIDSSSSDTSAVLPLRVRRTSHTSAAPMGSSQIPVQNAKHYKDAPLPSLSISIPVPTRPLATAVRGETPDKAEARQSQTTDQPRQQQSAPGPEKAEPSKMVTFAPDEDDSDLSDQTSICQSPTWDARKKKKAKPPKQSKLDPVAAKKTEDAPPSPKKKGRRLSKQPPTPGAQAKPIAVVERSSSATRFDIEEIESQAPQNKALRSKPPDAMKNPDLHQQGNPADSNDKPRSKGFFSRIRRLSFDDGAKSPKSSAEQVVAPPPVQKSHSSGPGAGLGFFSSRKPHSKDTSKSSSPRAQSVVDSRPPVTTRPSSSGKGRSNSLLAATMDMFKTGQKASVEVHDGATAHESTKTSNSDPTTAGRTPTIVADDKIAPFDLDPPMANFSQKPRSRSSDSRSTLDNRPDSKDSDRNKASANPNHPYQTNKSKDESEFGSLSTLRLQQPTPSELALKSARSAEFETASIQESIFNVVKLEDRSSDYLNFINESYTPPSLDLVAPAGGRSSPMRPVPAPRATYDIFPRSARDSNQAREQKATNPRHSEQQYKAKAETTEKKPIVQSRPADISKPLPPLQSSPSLEKFGQSWSAGSESAAADAANLGAPVFSGVEHGHSRTASEKSTSSLYDDSAPTPSTPATPDSIPLPRRQDIHPVLRGSSHEQRLKEESAHSGSSGERRPRNTARQYSQETARPTPDRSMSREPRTSEDSGSKAPSMLDLDPPPANFFSRADGNGSSSSLASSPTSIKSTSAIKVESPSSLQQERVRAREMPPRAQSAIDLTSTSFLPPLKHQPLQNKNKTKHSSVTVSPSSPDSADDESCAPRPEGSRANSANSHESGANSSVGAAYLEEARRAVQPISAARALRTPFTQKNASSASLKSTQPNRGEPIAKMLVECCGCKFYHDMPSKVYECMAKPDSIVEDKKLGVSAAVTTMVRCPWCGHGMSTQCCAGYAAVIFLKEKLHGK